MLETERLLLRMPTPDDAGMRRHLGQWRRNGVGKFVVVRRDDGAVVGRVGIQLLDPRTWERAAGRDGQPELGWTLAPEHRGNGYATEAALAVREWYEAERLVSLITADNVPSQRVATRLGATPTETVGDWVVWVHP